MATPAQIRAACDTAVTNAWAAITAKQDAYFAANGSYWQGYRSHSVTPADGATATPDIGTATPSDLVGQPWPAAIRSSSLPCSLEIHRYQTPRDGWGWLAIVSVTILGATWQKVQNGAGPETWRTTPWVQVN